MEIKRICYYLNFIMILTVFCLLLLRGIGLGAERFMISVPVEKLIGYLHGGNRILGYKIEILGGRVYSVMKIPADWSIEVDYRRVKNIPQLKADAGHGVSWLTAEDVKKGLFEKFLVIEPLPSEGKLNIKAYFEIDVPMKDKPKHIVIEKKDMVVTSILGH